MDELDWIERIRAKLGQPDPRVLLGIGDDAAVLAPSSAAQVLSVDASVEGAHFDRAWLSASEIGHRAYVAALSDLAAMGARPVAGLLAICASKGDAEALLDGILDGCAEAARAYGAPIIGGNLAAGRELSITTTVIGEAGPRILKREGAGEGDAIYVTGTLGEAALGWRILRAGGARGEVEERCVARWRRPRARFDVLDALAPVATAVIDVSDGLAQDLGHLARASGVAARVERARLPTAPGLGAAAAARGEDATNLALSGGEDYELIFTAPPDAVVAPEIATRIGEILPGRGVVIVDEDGREREAPAGYRHFT